jgi:hypothetical protein
MGCRGRTRKAGPKTGLNLALTPPRAGGHDKRERKAMSLGDERQQGDFARALDGNRQHALMVGTGAGTAPRQDLAAIGDESAQNVHVLVADVV